MTNRASVDFRQGFRSGSGTLEAPTTRKPAAAPAKITWRRRHDGRYDVIGVPIAEPHEFMGEKYDLARCRQIHANTIAEEPVGSLHIGHPLSPAQPEQIRVGETGNYTIDARGREYCDFLAIEPGVMLDIALKRYRTYSCEYRPPNYDAFTGVALLGRSQPFFPFARLEVEADAVQIEQMKRDAEAFPKPSQGRASLVDRYAFRIKEPAMKKQFRQVFKNGAFVHEVREYDDAKKDWGAWRQPAEGETKDDVAEQIAGCRQAVEELAGRVQAIEDKMSGGDRQAGSEDDKDKKDDKGGDDKKDEGARQQAEQDRAVKAGFKAVTADVEAIKADLAKQARQAVETRFHSRIDGLVAKGAVIDKGARTAIIRAVTAAEDKDRDTLFDDLTRNVRTAPLTDTDDPAKGTEGLEADTAGMAEAEAKDVSAYVRSLPSANRGKARDLLKEFRSMVANGEDSWNPALRRGAKFYVEANIG